MELLEKFKELHSSGMPMEEIVENIFLNYNAYVDNDLIYSAKKYISVKLGVELNSVKLIGSSHTGFKSFEERKDSKDYDFAIIDPFLYRNYLMDADLSKIRTEEIKGRKKIDNWSENVLLGKLHLLYSDSIMLKKINKTMEEVKILTGKKHGVEIDKSFSVCIYISERAFIRNLTQFLTVEWIRSMKSVAEIEGPFAPLKDFKFNS